MTRQRIFILLGCCVVLAVSVLGWFSPFGQFLFPLRVKLNAPDWSTRPSNYHEAFYTQIAGSFGDSNVCEKISPRAVNEELPSLETKYRVTFQRSECYFDAALKRKDKALCDLVTRIVTLPPNASEVSGSQCRRLLKNSGNSRFAPTPYFAPSASIMQEMGYRDQDYFEALTKHQVPASTKVGVADWGQFYSYLMFGASPDQQQDFLRRAERLPSY